MLTAKNSSCKHIGFYYQFLIIDSHYQFLIIDFPLPILSIDLLGIEREYWGSLDVAFITEILKD